MAQYKILNEDLSTTYITGKLLWLNNSEWIYHKKKDRMCISHFDSGLMAVEGNNFLSMKNELKEKLRDRQNILKFRERIRNLKKLNLYPVNIDAYR